jgi:hypothetical protein
LGILSKLDVTPEKFRLVAFDTEDDSHGNPTEYDFAWLEADSHLENPRSYHHFTTTSNDEAIKFIYDQPTSIFIAHNLEYDINNVFRKYDYKHVESISFTSRIVRMSLHGKKHTFLDSYNWFSHPLKKMGQVVGIEKGKLDPHSVEYVRGDTNILLKFIHYFQDRITNEVGVPISATIGGMSMAAFRSRFLEHPVQAWNNPICIEAFAGGRCEIFYKGMIEGDIHVVDVNSMYMDVMTQEFPNPERMVSKSTWKKHEFGVGHFDIEMPPVHIPILGYHSNNKLLFPCGKFSGAWTYEEIREAAKMGAKVQQLDGFGTNSGQKYFLEFENYFYGQRLKAKLENEAFGDKFYKGIGVNLYGKFIQHKPRIEARTVLMSEKEEKKENAKLKMKCGPFLMYECEMKEPPRTACYLWGCHVTAKARIKITRILNTIHTCGDTVLYTDTDSAFFCGNNSLPHLDLDQTRLGALDREDYRKAEFIIAKGYIMYPKDETKPPKIACKGIPLPRDFPPEKLETLDNPQMQFLRNGASSTLKPYRLRQALREGKTPNFWRSVKKNRHTEYSKRLGNGVTKPLILDE